MESINFLIAVSILLFILYLDFKFKPSKTVSNYIYLFVVFMFILCLSGFLEYVIDKFLG